MITGPAHQPRNNIRYGDEERNDSSKPQGKNILKSLNSPIPSGTRRIWGNFAHVVSLALFWNGLAHLLVNADDHLGILLRFGIMRIEDERLMVILQRVFVLFCPV